LQSFGAFLDGKLNFLLSFQLAIAVRLDRGEVDEHIFTTITTNEALALSGIEPLDGSDVAF
jgi:hypothetical protein